MALIGAPTSSNPHPGGAHPSKGPNTTQGHHTFTCKEDSSACSPPDPGRASRRPWEPETPGTPHRSSGQPCMSGAAKGHRVCQIQPAGLPITIFIAEAQLTDQGKPSVIPASRPFKRRETFLQAGQSAQTAALHSGVVWYLMRLFCSQNWARSGCPFSYAGLVLTEFGFRVKDLLCLTLALWKDRTDIQKVKNVQWRNQQLWGDGLQRAFHTRWDPAKYFTTPSGIHHLLRTWSMFQAADSSA